MKQCRAQNAQTTRTSYNMIHAKPARLQTPCLRQLVVRQLACDTFKHCWQLAMKALQTQAVCSAAGSFQKLPIFCEQCYCGYGSCWHALVCAARSLQTRRGPLSKEHINTGACPNPTPFLRDTQSQNERRHTKSRSSESHRSRTQSLNHGSSVGRSAETTETTGGTGPGGSPHYWNLLIAV